MTHYVAKYDSDDNKELIFVGTKEACETFIEENEEHIRAQGFYLMLEAK